MRRIKTAAVRSLWLVLWYGQLRTSCTEPLLWMVRIKLCIHISHQFCRLSPLIPFYFAAEDIPELLSSSSLFSMLLPLILAYIGPVAASVPKVRNLLTLFENY